VVARVRIKIEVREARTFIGLTEKFWEGAGKDWLEFGKRRGLEILREEVPKGKTKQLHDSCWAEISGKTVKIGTAVSYDEFVDGEGKTDMSHGRYVPAIEKKLVKTILSPKEAIEKKAKRMGIPIKLRKDMKIKFYPEAMALKDPKGPAAGIYRHVIRQYRAQKVPPPSIHIAAMMKRKRQMEKVLAHELWHAVQDAADRGFNEAEAMAVEKSMDRDIGMHPGSKKTPYSKRTYERLREEMEGKMFDLMRSSPS